MNGWYYYLTALVLWGGVALRVPRLLHPRRDPALVSLCAVVLSAGVSFTLSAPDSVAAVNRLAGVPNLAAPLVYTVVTVASAACLVVIVYWRGGDPDHVRRVVHGWLTAYALVIVTLWLLFALGHAPVERRTDLDTYYARTPFIREMIALYLVAHLGATFTTATLCRRWSRQVTGWTHRGLVVLAWGWLVNSLFSVVKMAAVAGRLTGHDWDVLSTDLAPGAASVGAVLVTVGYTLPLLGPRIDSLVLYARLGPLFRLLVGPADRQYRVALTWRSKADIDLRLTQRETGIRDGITRLGPRLDDRVRARAHDRALSTGASTPEAEAIGAAAMVVIAARAGTPATAAPRDHAVTVLDGNLSDLVRVSRAVNTSVVADLLRADRKPETQRT
ncbi:MAB_1171c family putative transporter [Streptomyces sp. NPDC048664]|uniref:MAB_1171c family putative transporter n=1 Tax=Streptomyces sp. NPDC048664 TaxID=3154505 RepID=UPI0034335476